MKVVNMIDEDFTQYKKPSMFIGFPSCSFKCCLECNNNVCQNSSLAKADKIEVSCSKLIDRYLDNPITKAIVCGGLEPFDSFNDLLELVKKLREKSNDDFVIYTGYTEDEIKDCIDILSEYDNIIVKFGRYIPNQEQHFDEVLGINLASTNQYGKHLTNKD